MGCEEREDGAVESRRPGKRLVVFKTAMGKKQTLNRICCQSAAIFLVSHPWQDRYAVP
jgi:hypothetical protein